MFGVCNGLAVCCVCEAGWGVGGFCGAVLLCEMSVGQWLIVLGCL